MQLTTVQETPKAMDMSKKKENRTENEISLSIIELVKEITDNEIQNEYAKQLTDFQNKYL